MKIYINKFSSNHSDIVYFLFDSESVFDFNLTWQQVMMKSKVNWWTIWKTEIAAENIRTCELYLTPTRKNIPFLVLWNYTRTVMNKLKELVNCYEKHPQTS